MKGREIEDQLTLYGQSFTSRLLLGTARYDSPSLLADAICAAEPAMLTVSLRRQLSGSKDSGQSFWNLLRETQRVILPNTAGCLTAREAVKTASMARELFQTNLIKLEVIGDEVNLQPDPFGLVEAAIELVNLGFQVLPYCTEDWVLCRRLMDAGCEVIMKTSGSSFESKHRRYRFRQRSTGRARLPEMPTSPLLMPFTKKSYSYALAACRTILDDSVAHDDLLPRSWRSFVTRFWQTPL